MSFDDHFYRFREQLPEDGFVAPIAAKDFVEFMLAKHPDELAEWERARTVAHVALKLTRAARSDRTNVRQRLRSELFAEAAESGDMKAMRTFDLEFVIDGGGRRKKLPRMNGPELRFAAVGYDRQVEPLKAMSAFLMALAKRVGPSKTVDDVLSVAECDRLLQSFLPSSVVPKLNLAA